MIKRKTLTRAMTLDIVTQQLSEGRCVHVGEGSFRLGCAICKKPIDRICPVVGEHMTPLALGGKDDTSNIRFVHKHCADKKTNGQKHTTLGSDRHSISKVKRLRGETGQGPKAKIQSRPFPKDMTKHFDGSVTRRGQ